jgi:uncharacterized protein (UPF0261 family)
LEAFVQKRFADGECAAVIGIGGAGGTQSARRQCAACRWAPQADAEHPRGGHMRWYVEDSDIAMFPSITDVRASTASCKWCSTVRRAGRAAALWYAGRFESHAARMADRSVPRIGQTMYGTTTKGVTFAREELERRGYETLVFHASGAGGRAMERLVRQGVIHGVLDMTIAEIGAHLVGGLHDAGPRRLEAMRDTGVPLLLVPGAADTVVLPPMSDLPEKFRHGRILNKHNPTMTTMRTSVERIGASGRLSSKSSGTRKAR